MAKSCDISANNVIFFSLIFFHCPFLSSFFLCLGRWLVLAMYVYVVQHLMEDMLNVQFLALFSASIYECFFFIIIFILRQNFSD